MSEEPQGLTPLSLPDLKALQHAVETGRLDCPLTESGLLSIGLARRSADVLAVLGGLDRGAIQAVLAVAIAERIYRSPPHLDLVWTGPEARSATTRDTAIVVRQFFQQAQRAVLVGGFRFDHGEDLLRPLHEGMKERGVQATFFLDIEDHARTPVEADAYATKMIDRFFRDNWPFGDPRPDIYYDPRTAVAGPPWASLHAKCIVIDEHKTFITSANFTQRGQTRNIEAGILIEDDDFAKRVIGQWRGLIEQGLVNRYRGCGPDSPLTI